MNGQWSVTSHHPIIADMWHIRDAQRTTETDAAVDGRLLCIHGSSQRFDLRHTNLFSIWFQFNSFPSPEDVQRSYDNCSVRAMGRFCLCFFGGGATEKLLQKIGKLETYKRKLVQIPKIHTFHSCLKSYHTNKYQYRTRPRGPTDFTNTETLTVLTDPVHEIRHLSLLSKFRRQNTLKTGKKWREKVQFVNKIEKNKSSGLTIPCA